MADWQTRALFLREFHWRRPKASVGFGAKAKPTPQTFPRDFISAAIRAGAAIPVRKKIQSQDAPDLVRNPETTGGQFGTAHH